MPASPETREVLLVALRDIRPELSTISERLVAAMPTAERTEFDPGMREQFLNALEAVMLEALEGTSTETRSFIFEVAIPAMVDQGRTAMSLLEGHVALFILLTGQLVAEVPGERRAAAEAWLAVYFAGFVRELTEVAQRTEAGNA